MVEIYNHTEKDSKIFINEVTQVSNAQPGDCFFQFKDILDEHSVQTLDDIIKETKSMDMVNFSAKVVSKEPTQNASKNLQLAHCVVADTPSSFVRLVLWQQHIDMVTVDQVYTVKQIRVREKDEGIVLNTSMDTNILPMMNDELARIEVADEDISKLIGRKYVAVQLVHQLKMFVL